jgi:uncharacterized membrane protein YdjX (TVP38/TMEM64 family)
MKLHEVKLNILDFIKEHKRLVITICCFLLASFILFILVFTQKQALENFLTSFYYSKYNFLIIGLFIIICSIPPIVGYGLLLTFSGYVLGVWYGFLLNYVASLIGSIIVFYGARNVSQFMSLKYDEVMINRIAQQSSLSLLILLRFTPVPFSYSNILFSALPISFTYFLIPVLLALFKTIFHAYIGFSLREIVGTPILLDDGSVYWSGNLYNHPISWSQILLGLVGLVASTVLGWKVYRIVQKILNDHCEEVELTSLEQGLS